MKNKVLTTEQMQELIDMGIDVSNSVIGWFKWNDENTWYLFNETIVQRRKRVETLIENNCIYEEDYELYKYTFIPTFTLQDILDMLPQGFYLEQNTISLDKKVFLQINKTAGGGYSIAYEQSWDEDGKLKIKMHGQQLKDSLLEAAFNMLKWCKQNNYI